MRVVQNLHSWKVSVDEARGIQQSLRQRVVCEDRFIEVNSVAGVDVGFEDRGQVTRAALVVLAFPGLQVIDQVIAKRPTEFPYIPGLLSFREIPAVLDAFKKLAVAPDLVLCDGQGIAHPRRFGIACHLGLLLDLPSIGVAKTRLIGTHVEPPNARGSHVPLMHKGEKVGVVLRTRSGVRPVYVSVGHKISLNTAIGFVMSCVTRYRLPETTRWADRLASNRGPGACPPRGQ